MSKEYLYIGIGVVIVINFILFFTMSKKKSASKVRTSRPQPSPVNHVEVSQERHTKTEALGVPKSAPQVQDSNRTEALGVPTSTPQVNEPKNSTHSISIPNVSTSSPSAASDNKTVALGVEFPKVPALPESEKTQLLMSAEPELAFEPEVAATLEEALPLATITYSVNEAQHTFTMVSGVIKIGRDPDNVDLVLAEEKFAGRVHAEIEWKENSFYLTDLNSKNGTFVGEEKLTGQVEITDGAVFKIGKTELTFKVGA